MADIRESVARYYDATTRFSSDIEFYPDHIPVDDRTVLELGCGTGRVLLPLSEHCDRIVGVDKSRAMLDVCRRKLAGREHARVELVEGDLTSLDIGRTFGLAVAPFRVFQNIATDEDVGRVFDTVARHLSPEGTCILNVFNPNARPEELIPEWDDDSEIASFEMPFRDGILKQAYRKRAIETSPLVLYPEIIYRYYVHGELVDEASFVTTMRVWYPDEFVALIQDHGYDILEKWGGYRGERYGEGRELVVKFRGPT